MRTFKVAFPALYSVPEWQDSNDRDERPDRWPYGLDQLQDHLPAATLIPESAATPSPASLARAFLSSTSTPSSRTSATITWDEWTAAKEIASSPATPVYAGVIWLTDPPEGFRASSRSMLTKRLLRRAAGLWCLSAPQVERVRSTLGSDSPPVSYLPFGIDSKFYSAAPYPERPLIVSVGGDRDRDTATLFSALEQVLRAIPGVGVVVQSQSTATPPIGVSVVPYLPHTELRSLYRSASVVAIATRDNLHGSGMTVALEAMSTARPVIITGTPGIDEYVLPDVTGRVVPVGDSAALADAIIAALRDPDTAETLGLAGRAHVEAHHTSTTMAAALARLIG